MITWHWLAEHTCIRLDFEKEFQKLKRMTSDFDLNAVIHLNMKENWHATKRSLLVEKQNDK